MLLEPPLIPGDDTAQQWAEQELAKNKYNVDESLWDRISAWLNDVLNSIGDGTPGNKGLAIAVIVILIFLAVLFIVRPIIKARKLHQNQNSQTAKASAALFNDTRNTQALLSAAEDASARGDIGSAFIEGFRAAIRSLEDDGLLKVTPNLTAYEAGHSAARITGSTELFTQSAWWFDQMYYGGHHPAPEVGELGKQLHHFALDQQRGK